MADGQKEKNSRRTNDGRRSKRIRAGIKMAGQKEKQSAVEAAMGRREKKNSTGGPKRRVSVHRFFLMASHSRLTGNQ